MANAASGVNQEDGQIGDKQVDIGKWVHS
jgi:hypothetical protein